MHIKRVIILANGEIENLRFYKKYFNKEAYVICANGGLKIAQRLKIKPDLVIGDFDSVGKSLLSRLKKAGTTLKKFPQRKNKSDLHLALDEAISKKPSEIIIIGALGKRIDQTLTNIFLLLRALKKKVPAKIISSRYELFLINSKFLIKNKKGKRISLLPLTPKADRVSLFGFKYLLSDEDLFYNKSRGLSNLVASNLAKVSIKKGILLAILER